jgi:hypothetical protein
LFDLYQVAINVWFVRLITTSHTPQRLDHTLIWNGRHLRHTLRQFERRYNLHRPHQAIDETAPPTRRLRTTHRTQITHLDVRRRERALGGILNCADGVFGRPRALASKGSAFLPLLSDELFAALGRELNKGPLAHGWPDQTWTLARIKTLIGRRFHMSYTIQGVAALLKRHGCRAWNDRGGARRLARLRGRGKPGERSRLIYRPCPDQYRHDILDGCLTGTGLATASP